jgi:hemoglobin-like flavoprotein
MTPEQKTLVQSTWEQVVPISDTAAKLFYEKLFELDPNLRPLFKPDMEEQRRVLMSTITFAVRGLDRLDEVVPAVQALGRRHVQYGVKNEDYDTVGAALLWTLGQGLGEGFTPEAEEAWATVYGILANTMKAAAAA